MALAAIAVRVQVLFPAPGAREQRADRPLVRVLPELVLAPQVRRARHSQEQELRAQRVLKPVRQT